MKLAQGNSRVIEVLCVKFYQNLLKDSK